MNALTASAAEAARAQGRQTWPYEPLYQLLHTSMPSFRMASGILDVPALAVRLAVTPESIYKWFRSGKLPGGRARELHALMTAANNAALLTDAGLSAPELAELYAFCD